MPNLSVSRASTAPLRWLLPLAALLAVLVLAACGSDEGGDENDKPVALTTFTVLADMARQVAGDRIEVHSITKPGAEIHGYEPTPSDLKRAATADVVLENGLGLESWFAQFIERSRASRKTLSEGITPIPIAGESEYAGKPNPHAWMSTANAEVYIDNLVEAFSELDPAGAAEFRRRGADYKRQVRKVGKTVRQQLADLPREHRALVTCEGAFSYLARDLGLEEAYIWPVNAEQEGSPQQIASTVRFVRDRKVPAIFCESTVSDKSQQQVAREAGSRLAGTLYVDSLSEADGPVPTYLDLLRVDAETIVAGLNPQAR
ncbi:MAG: metal ABC transporter substrate-binding protein [Patulibacter sp.]|nr:metal ABC transporter substrate-binding protein [Patulibacter sp.]